MGQYSHTLEFGQATAAAGQFFQDARRIEACRIQRLQREKGCHEGFAALDVYRKTEFLYMLASTCIEKRDLYTCQGAYASSLGN